MDCVMQKPEDTSCSRKMHPKVGVAVMLLSDQNPNCVLLGLRKNTLGEGSYALPGGHLEFGETWEACAAREVQEETGLKVKDVHFGMAFNAIWEENETGMHHYVDIVMTATVDESQTAVPQNMEPEKCEGWEWRDWNHFPPHEKLFKPLQMIRDSDFNPFSTR